MHFERNTKLASWLQYFCIGFSWLVFQSFSFAAIRNYHSTAEMMFLLHPPAKLSSSRDVLKFTDVTKAKAQILPFYELWLQPYKPEFTKGPQTSVLLSGNIFFCIIFLFSFKSECFIFAIIIC